ncbi:redoxin domain-containing protein [Aeoliella mucimassa]|nr:redoxin domain-containing protein [Aeoliella mucimassa]
MNGVSMEIHRVEIAGLVVNDQGAPVADATVMAVGTPDQYGFGYERSPVEATTNASGEFAMVLEVLVLRDSSQQVGKQAVGEFCVFAIADGYGFTWAEECTFRPEPMPASLREAATKSLTGFYQDFSPAVKLTLEPPAVFEGVISDDQGNPLPNARIQAGVVNGPPEGQGREIRGCRLENESGTTSTFVAIDVLPANLRDTRTDELGHFSLPQLRTDTTYMALIDPGPEYDAKQLTLLTGDPPANADIRRTISTSDGIYSGQFACPRDVRIHLVTAEGEPIAGGCVLAHAKRQARYAGTNSRTNERGIAELRILPGEYTLLLDPPLDAPLLPRKAMLTVGDEASRELQYCLPAAATLRIHAVHEDDDSAIADIRFRYQTDSMDEPQLLSTQQVASDYRGTDSEGVLEVQLPPGEVTLLTETNPRGLTPVQSKSDPIVLVAGEAHDYEFRFDRSRRNPAATNQVLVADSTSPAEMAAEISRQRILLASSKGTFTANLFRGTCEASLEEVKTTLDAVPAAAVPDIRELYKQWTGQPLRMATQRTTFDGLRCKNETVTTSPESTPPLAADYVLFNGSEGVNYDDTNQQVDLFPQRSFHFAMNRLSNLTELMPPLLKDGEVIGDQYVFLLKEETETFELVANAKTGHLHRKSTVFSTGYGKFIWQFGSQEYDNGLRLPKLLVEIQSREGKIGILRIVEPTSVELVDELPADAFASPVPADTTVVDYHKMLTDDPNRPNVYRLNGPVTDLSRYALQERPVVEPTTPKQSQHQAAPFTVAGWVDQQGAIDAVDTSGKLVLVQFWANWCPQCEKQIADMNKAVATFADQPVVVLAIHASEMPEDNLVAYAKKYRITYPLAIDDHQAGNGFGDTAAAYGVRGVPTTAVIDRKGNLVYLGELKEAVAKVRELVKEPVDESK